MSEARLKRLKETMAETGSWSQKADLIFSYLEVLEDELERQNEQLAALAALYDGPQKAGVGQGQEAAIAAETPHQRLQRRFPYFPDNGKINVFEQHLAAIGNPTDSKIKEFFERWNPKKFYTKEMQQVQFCLTLPEQQAWQAIGRAKGAISFIEKKGYRIAENHSRPE